MKKKLFRILSSLAVLGPVLTGVLWILPALNPQPRGDYSALKDLYADEKAPREPLSCNSLPDIGRILYENENYKIYTVDAYTAEHPPAPLTQADKDLETTWNHLDMSALTKRADIVVDLEILEIVDLCAYSDHSPSSDAIATTAASGA